MDPIRLELPTGWQLGSVNAYLFTEPESILVDTGIANDEGWRMLEDGLAAYGLTVSDISRVIISHAHVDHFGQAGAIAANSDADIWISELGSPWLLETDRKRKEKALFYRTSFLPYLGLTEEAVELVMAGIKAMDEQTHPIPVERIHTFRADGTLQMGGRSWTVMHTPGHTSTQTCFHDPQNRLLLAGDMLLATTPTPVVECPPEGILERVPALPLFLDSLDALEALEIELVLPGHGRPFGDHVSVIRRQRKRIEKRKQECLDWIRAGYRTPVELLDKMYAHHPAGLRLTGMWMLVGYLDLLEQERAVARREIGGIWHYEALAGSMKGTEST